ncbi:hypothetical protein EXU85_33585 [Spirosoma sp. KCTC 42546]|uniref:ligand-binding sensor domain-containing protein n=1 Tax=Spirosoma sp. KCTC 42546 TaxID=2520506 RepID=UPI001157EE56|nr:histidine kinase [Spirosoma sp. KCTC 42546]QDK83270.1 hypothetical protein EXU85_33585 [Spirosoma sp. KCTC 42546]
MKGQLLLLFLLLGWLITTVQAQQPYIRAFTEKDGLPDGVLYSPFQDSKGYIWLTSTQGLARYNGRSFQPFRTQEGLAHNDIWGLFEDQCGHLFFETYFNDSLTIQYFDLRTDRIRQVRVAPEHILYQKKISTLSFSTAFLQYQTIGPDTVLVYLNHFNDSQNFFALLLHCSADGVNVIAPPQTMRQGMPLGNVFLAGNVAMQVAHQKTVIWRFKHNTWQRFASVDNPNNTPIDIDNMLLLTDSTFLVGTNKGIELYHRSGRKLASHPIQTDRLFGYQQLPNGYISYETSEKKREVMSPQLKRLPFSDFLQSLQIKSLTVDRQKNWWFTTVNNDFLMVPEQALANSRTWSFGEALRYIAKDRQGRYWVGTETGRLLYRPANAPTWQPLRFSPPFNDYIRGLACTPTGHLLIANNRQLAITYIDKPTLPNYIPLKISRYFSDTVPMQIPLRIPLSITAAPKSITNGPTVYIAEGSRTWQASFRPNQIRFLPVAVGKSYTAVPVGKWLYLGRPDGLYRVPLGHINASPQTVSGFPASSVTTLAADSAGLLYVAYEAGGLWLHKPQTGHLRELPQFTGTVVNRVVTDRPGHAWACTQSEGLVELLDGRTIRTIDQADGLPSNQVLDVWPEARQLAVATAGGFTELNRAQQLAWPSHRSQLRIKSVTFPVDRQDSTLLYPQAGQDLLLDNQDNTIRLMLENLDFQATGTMMYTYQLLKADDTVAVVRKPDLTYELHYLQPGPYRLLVSSSDGAHVQFAFRIRRPIWQQWWFWLLIGGVVGLAIFYQFQLRIKRATLELRALQGQVNAHFAANFIEVIKNLTLREEKFKAFDMLSLFGSLMRSFVVASRQKHIRLEDEISFIQRYIHLTKQVYYLQKETELTESISISEALDPKTLIQPLLVQPIVENAIKYGIFHKGSASRLIVRFDPYQPGIIRCIVEDDGVGRQRVADIQEQEQQALASLGQKISKSKGSIEVMREAGISVQFIDLEQGTRVELMLKVIKS